MHLLIPYAAPLSEAGRQAAAALALPNLRWLLARWAEVQRDSADEWSLSPPHERALALALGWRGGCGQLPWAARAARADGIPPGDQPWGLMTPGHWHLGTEQVSLLDPATLVLDEAGARVFFDAVQPLFASQGYVMRYGAPQRWYVAHESLATLATASLDRVIGRNVDAWLGKDPAARALRRLQSEVQMLLYTHPLNDERAARGLLPVNSFWLSGCGVAQPEAGALPTLDERLRAPALAENWAAWVKAWDSLDAGPLATLRERAAQGADACLTLCGERDWVRLAPAPGGLLRHARALLQRPAPATLLETL
ncbi:MAG: hypothetical protein C0505_12630 [Leptothrix sp. (in: Bacteria)]|nr:hypothetical protein [Leptothrix sp. (in: b-proteobacteria)]